MVHRVMDAELLLPGPAGLFYVSGSELLLQLLAGKLSATGIVQAFTEFQKAALADRCGDAAKRSECRSGNTI